MKDIKLSFPYPKTSRHNLSQDIATSLSMGLLTPIRVVQVNPGDSHRIGTSFSLISNPLLKPLLQGIRMRYCRFWVPSRIYHMDRRANNMDYDPQSAGIRYGAMSNFCFPTSDTANSVVTNFQASSLFDYLQLAPIESNFINMMSDPGVGKAMQAGIVPLRFNAEPYIAYYDIVRNYFADSATGMVAFSTLPGDSNDSNRYTLVAPLAGLDDYIDRIQNQTSSTIVSPYDPSLALSSSSSNFTTPFILHPSTLYQNFELPAPIGNSFNLNYFGAAHVGLCVPMLRPDRLSRLFDTRPLTSQNATVSSSEVSIANLSFLAKFQRFLTRKFFGGSRYTDVMYSVFGQKVPHVDSPVLLDVFDQEIGSELVASTNASTTQNPGILGGYLSAQGNLSTSRGRFRKRYTFNESGYLIDLVYIMPRIFRTSFWPDFYPAAQAFKPAQANFIPDFNGIGWQQPTFAINFRPVTNPYVDNWTPSNTLAFSCEPSWQQFRTLPDVCTGCVNPIRGESTTRPQGLVVVPAAHRINSPIFFFSDRMSPYTCFSGSEPATQAEEFLLAGLCFVDFNDLNSVFGTSYLYQDNIFAVFRYSHQVKSQVSKRFTLSF